MPSRKKNFVSLGLIILAVDDHPNGATQDRVNGAT